MLLQLGVPACDLGSDLEGKRLGGRRGGGCIESRQQLLRVEAEARVERLARGFADRRRDQPEAAVEEQTLEAA